MKKIIIFGGGGYSEVVNRTIMDEKKYNPIGYIDMAKNNLNKLKYLGNIEKNTKLIKNKKLYGVVAVGSNYIRKKIVDDVNKLNPKFKWATIKHPSVVVCETCHIGLGTVLLSGVVVSSHSRLGSHCLINTSTSIDHDNFLDDFSSTGPGVNTGGNVLIGKFCYIGIGAAIKHNIKIQKNTVIGAKSYVNSNCKMNSLYFGIPAKRIRNWKYGEKYL